MPQLVQRAANEAARAVVRVIEQHTEKPVNLYDCMRLVHCIGAALERNGLEGGPPGSIRAILEEEYRGDCTTFELVNGKALEQADPDGAAEDR